MTAFGPNTGPENPEKGEKPPGESDAPPFSTFSTFSEPGTVKNTFSSGQAAAALAAVRAYRRTPPPELPKPPRKARHRPAATLDASPASPPPGVPLDWCKGVALLATRPAPDSITPRRWHVFQADAVRLLHGHGAELHRQGWDALDLFGLHPTAPAAHPPGWGLAWLLHDAAVAGVTAEAVGVRRGALLSYRRPTAAARAVRVLAWLLGGPAS